jgi:hypothetical protein
VASACDTVLLSSHSSLQLRQAHPVTPAQARDRFNQCASAYRQIRGEDPPTVMDVKATSLPTLTAGGSNIGRCAHRGNECSRSNAKLDPRRFRDLATLCSKTASRHATRDGGTAQSAYPRRSGGDRRGANPARLHDNYFGVWVVGRPSTAIGSGSAANRADRRSEARGPAARASRWGSHETVRCHSIGERPCLAGLTAGGKRIRTHSPI